MAVGGETTRELVSDNEGSKDALSASVYSEYYCWVKGIIVVNVEKTTTNACPQNFSQWV